LDAIGSPGEEHTHTARQAGAHTTEAHHTRMERDRTKEKPARIITHLPQPCTSSEDAATPAPANAACGRRRRCRRRLLLGCRQGDSSGGGARRWRSRSHNPPQPYLHPLRSAPSRHAQALLSTHHSSRGGARSCFSPPRRVAGRATLGEPPRAASWQVASPPQRQDNTGALHNISMLEGARRGERWRGVAGEVEGGRPCGGVPENHACTPRA